MNPTDKINELLDEAHKLAIEWVEVEARRLLKENSWLKEFVMAMGSAFFTTKDGRTIDIWSLNVGYELTDFMDKFNSTLGITGTPMTFTKDGPKITDW